MNTPRNSDGGAAVCYPENKKDLIREHFMNTEERLEELRIMQEIGNRYDTDGTIFL